MTGRAMTSNKREYAVGGQARYRNPPVTEPTKREFAALRSSHPAIIHGRTMFPKSVFDASERDHALIPGINNAKTGNQITVGPWAGFRHFNLSLEERATCPLACENFDTCFGNGMPVAVRFEHNEALMESLDWELADLSRRFPRGFSVRLHILGDFPDVAYVRRWIEWSDRFKALHIWGYTARPNDGAIGKVISAMNRRRPSRWMIRFSVPDGTKHAPMQVATTWKKPDQYAFAPDTKSLICPQEIGNTDHCATCGICWNPKLAHVRVRFLGHGNVNGKRGGRPAKTDAKYAGPVPAVRNPAPPLPSERFDSVEAFIAGRGVTRLPPAKARGL